MRTPSNTPKNGWFEGFSNEYLNWRPKYPDSFFLWLSSKALQRKICWDVGCGNGQATVSLTKYFQQVYATDISPSQIDSAKQHSRIKYHVSSAENSNLKNESIDLINVAAAIHWFDINSFNAEALRVIRPGGIMVWLGYAPIEGAPPILQSWLDNLYKNRLKDLWPPEKKLVDTKYKELPFPGKSKNIPEDFYISLTLNIRELIGFISTWSAIRQKTKSNLPKVLEAELLNIWPNQLENIEIRLPLFGRWGYLKND